MGKMGDRGMSLRNELIEVDDWMLLFLRENVKTQKDVNKLIVSVGWYLENTELEREEE